MVHISNSHWTKLRHETAYRIARLRFRVFAMEQGITSEEDLDGRELEPTTSIWWAQEQGHPISTLRVLREDVGRISIGRVATEKTVRGRGIATALMQAALAYYPDQRIEVHAQAYLEDWYAKLGMVREGDVFQEAGIDHVMMVREPLMQLKNIVLDDSFETISDDDYDAPSEVDPGTPAPNTPRYFEEASRRQRRRD